MTTVGCSMRRRRLLCNRYPFLRLTVVARYRLPGHEVDTCSWSRFIVCRVPVAHQNPMPGMWKSKTVGTRYPLFLTPRIRVSFGISLDRVCGCDVVTTGCLKLGNCSCRKMYVACNHVLAKMRSHDESPSCSILRPISPFSCS
jgi:hypothetical protein